MPEESSTDYVYEHPGFSGTAVTNSFSSPEDNSWCVIWNGTNLERVWDGSLVLLKCARCGREQEGVPISGRDFYCAECLLEMSRLTAKKVGVRVIRFRERQDDR